MPETGAEYFGAFDTATYQGATIQGVFDNVYTEVQGTEARRPVFMGAASDLSGVQRGQSITVKGKAYTVVGVQPDGDGTHTLLVLQV